MQGPEMKIFHHANDRSFIHYLQLFPDWRLPSNFFNGGLVEDIRAVDIARETFRKISPGDKLDPECLDKVMVHHKPADHGVLAFAHAFVPIILIHGRFAREKIRNRNTQHIGIL